MKNLDDIVEYDKMIGRQRLYQFLTPIDDKYEIVRRDILKQELVPSVESAYPTVRQETARA